MEATHVQQIANGPGRRVHELADGQDDEHLRTRLELRSEQRQYPLWKDEKQQEQGHARDGRQHGRAHRQSGHTFLVVGGVQRCESRRCHRTVRQQQKPRQQRRAGRSRVDPHIGRRREHAEYQHIRKGHHDICDGRAVHGHGRGKNPAKLY